MKRRFYYLASPYSHPDRKVRAKREKAVTILAGHLIFLDIIVFPPITSSVQISKRHNFGGSWKHWRNNDLTFLVNSKAVIVHKQKGYKESVGVQAELREARKLGLPIYYLPDKYTPKDLENLKRKLK